MLPWKKNFINKIAHNAHARAVLTVCAEWEDAVFRGIFGYQEPPCIHGKSLASAVRAAREPCFLRAVIWAVCFVKTP